MKAVAVLVLVAVSLVGCSDDGSGAAVTSAPPATTSATTTTTTVPPDTPTTTSSTTTEPTTTSTTTTPTTIEPPPTTTETSLFEFSVASRGFFPDPLPGSDQAHGSGCVVGGSELPDGMWFGFVEGITADAVTFDLACFWTGEAAVAAATADGEEEIFDFYIRNNNTQTRTVARSPAGTAYWLDGAGDLTPQAIPMNDWPVTSDTAYQDCPSRHCAGWLYINDGQVTELIEQYLP
ncbi:MAG: hypothetical protein ACXW1Y_12695 [Acidimicrobiia bacterium]